MKKVKFFVLLCAVMITAMFCQSNAAAQNNQEQLLYERINSYLVKKQYLEAENALDTAISRYPTNLVLYIVKSGIYVGKCTALMEKYKVVLDKISSLKKTLRNNASEKANVESELASQEKVAAAIKSDFMTNLNKATDCYKQVLAKDANNYEANFQLGIVSFNKAEIVEFEKGEIYPWEDRDGSQIAAKDKELHAYWMESSKWFEMAHKAKPTEYDPLQNLTLCYYKLRDTANWNRVKVELDKLKSGEVIASASDNTVKTTTQTTNNVSSASTTSTATSNNITQNNNNRRVSSDYMAAVMLWKIVGEVASTVKEGWDSRYSSSSDSYSSSDAAVAANPKYGDYVQFEVYYSCGLLCSTPNFIIKGYVREFRSRTSWNDLRIEVSSVSGKPDVKYTDSDWKIVNENVKIGEELSISGPIRGEGNYQNLMILKRY